MAEAPSTPVVTGLLTPDQTAQRLGISPSTLKRMRLRGDGPQVIRITGRTIRYQATDIDAWLNRRATPIGATRQVQNG